MKDTGIVRRRYNMKGRFQMKEGKNWILPIEINANRFFRDSYWLEIWKKPFISLYGTEWRARGYGLCSYSSICSVALQQFCT